MSIHGIGCDLVETHRLQGLYDKYGEKLLRRLLTEKERQQALSQRSPVPRLAKYWAAKEAAFKALGVSHNLGISWQHFEVTYAEGGAPKLRIIAQARALLPKQVTVHLSLSDTATHAMAYVVIEVL